MIACWLGPGGAMSWLSPDGIYKRLVYRMLRRHDTLPGEYIYSGWQSLAVHFPEDTPPPMMMQISNCLVLALACSGFLLALVAADEEEISMTLDEVVDLIEPFGDGCTPKPLRGESVWHLVGETGP